MSETQEGSAICGTEVCRGPGIVAHFSSCFMVAAATFEALTSSAVSFSAARRDGQRARVWESAGAEPASHALAAASEAETPQRAASVRCRVSLALRGRGNAHASASLFSVRAKIWLSAFSCSFSYSFRFFKHCKQHGHTARTPARSAGRRQSG